MCVCWFLGPLLRFQRPFCLHSSLFKPFSKMHVNNIQNFTGFSLVAVWRGQEAGALPWWDGDTRREWEKLSHVLVAFMCLKTLVLIKLSWTQERAGSIPVGSVFCSGGISGKPPTSVICKARTGQTSLPTVLLFVSQNETLECRVGRPDWLNRHWLPTKQKSILSFLTARQAERAAGLGWAVPAGWTPYIVASSVSFKAFPSWSCGRFPWKRPAP